MDIDILTTIIGVLLTALIITAVFRYFRLPVVLGYLTVGILTGPHAIGLMPDVSDINHLAEFGIVFLLFTVGLEFSQPKLFALKSAVFIIGTIQVLLSIFITMAIGLMIGMDSVASFVVGSVVAMSSTAIVIKQLNDQAELYTPYGLDVVGILLFQDLAVIPLMILMAAFSHSNNDSLTYLFTSAVLKGLLAIFVISLAGRYVLKPLFHMIAKTKVIELFTLTVLLITLAAAWLTNLLGLSYALGAFLAGMMLSETEFRHQIEIEIRPFRDVLLGLFFISVGLLTDFAHWHQTWPWILLLLSALIIGKLLLISIISRLTGRSWSTALSTGMTLAQGSEFGFVLLTLALTYELVPVEYGQVILAAILLSMAISPLLIFFNKRISSYCAPFMTAKPDDHLRKPASNAVLKNHIVICGYGRVGQHVAKLLTHIPYPYLAIDLDSSLIQQAALAGDAVIYGDATHPAILSIAGIKHAKAIVICFVDVNTTIKAIGIIRQTYHNIPILVRCKDQNDWTLLQNQGATRIVTEIFEESMTLAHQVLEILEVPQNKIINLFSEVRNRNYELLRQVFQSPLNVETASDPFIAGQLTPIIIPADAYALHRKLDEFSLKDIQVDIVSVRRGQNKPFKPAPDFTIEAGDVIIVYGTIEATQKAESLFLSGEWL